MSSVTFVDTVTNVPARWANDVDALVYDIFGGAVDKTQARSNLGLGSLALQNASGVIINGGMIDNVNIGSITPGPSRFSNVTIESTPVSNKHATPKIYVDTLFNSANNGLAAHIADTSLHLTTTQNSFLDGIAITSTEANRLAGITSNVQFQLNNKLDKTGGIVTGNVGVVGTLDMNGYRIINLATPVNPTDGANKAYVDGASSALGGAYGAPVQNLAALASLPSGTLSDKQIRLVEDEGSIFYYDSTSTQPVDGVNVLAPPDSIGRWLRSVTGSAPHNSAPGIQGGSTNNYWHLTAAQHSYLTTLATATNVSVTEFGYLDGVTSGIQTQINNKVQKTGDTMTGVLTILHNAPSPALVVSSSLSGTDSTIAINANNGVRRLSFRNNGTETVSLSSDLNNSIWAANGSISINPSNRVIVGPLGSDDGITFFQVQGASKINGALNMSNFRITNLATPVNPTDGANKAYVDSVVVGGSFLPISGGTMAGDINMFGFKVTNLGAPTAVGDAINKGYADGNYLKLSGGTLTGNVTSQNVSGIAYRILNTVSGNAGELSLDTNSGNRSITFRDSGSVISSISVSASTNMELTTVGVIALNSSTGRVIVGALGSDDAATTFQVGGSARIDGILNMQSHRITNVLTPVNPTDGANKAYVDSLGAVFPLLAPDSLPTAPSYTFGSNTSIGLSLTSSNLTLLGGNGILNIKASDNATSGGTILVQGGMATASGLAGNITLASGVGQAAANSGSIILLASNATGTGSGGSLQIETGGVLRFDLRANGEWRVGGNAGLAGQAIVSNGPGSSPSWQAVSTVTVITGNAFENITQNDFVSVFSNAGVCTVRKAFAGTSNQFIAVGYALNTITAGNPVEVVMTENRMTAPIVLVPGDTYYLSNTLPGQITNVAPSGSGEVVQTVGVAETTSILVVTLSRDPITL